MKNAQRYKEIEKLFKFTLSVFCGIKVLIIRLSLSVTSIILSPSAKKNFSSHLEELL